MKKVNFFLEILDKNFNNFLENGDFDCNSYSINDIYSNKIF